MSYQLLTSERLCYEELRKKITGMANGKNTYNVSIPVPNVMVIPSVISSGTVTKIETIHQQHQNCRIKITSAL